MRTSFVGERVGEELGAFDGGSVTPMGDLDGELVGGEVGGGVTGVTATQVLPDHVHNGSLLHRRSFLPEHICSARCM